MINSYFSGLFCHLKSVTVTKRLFPAPSRKSLLPTQPYNIPEARNTTFYSRLAFQGGISRQV